MIGSVKDIRERIESDPALRVYSLTSQPFHLFQKDQNRWIYEISGNHELASVVMCEHPPIITIGREGSRQQIRFSHDELQHREWTIQYVARGGGTMLHVPGQLCLYPLIPLALIRRTPRQFLDELLDVVASVIRERGVEAAIDTERPGIRIRGRRVAHAGMAIRSGITAYGIVLNVNPDLELFEKIDCDGDTLAMTSLERELVTRVRPSSIRIDLVNSLSARLGYSRHSWFHSQNKPYANIDRT